MREAKNVAASVIKGPSPKEGGRLLAPHIVTAQSAGEVVLLSRGGGGASATLHLHKREMVERERELARLRRSVGGPWRRVAGLAFRRALGRVVASL